MKKITLVLLWALISTASFSQDRPTGKRISITNPTHDQLHTLISFGVDLACGANFVDSNVVLELSSEFIPLLDQNNINYTVLIDDLTLHFKEVTQNELPIARAELELKKQQTLMHRQLSIESESIDNLVQYEGCTEINWDNNVPSEFKLGSMAGCLTYDEVLAELDLMRSMYPNLISVKTPISTNPAHQTNGNSFTNGGQYDTWAPLDVLYVRISDNPDTDEMNEPESLYSGMTHSREVSSMMNLMYYMWYILENYATDPGIKNLVDNHEMYFIPVANPDGLKWNEQIAPSGGGMQRKNLGPYNTGNSALRGADLNRNYDYFFGPSYVVGGVGSSGSTGVDTYRGPSAFSEPETSGIQEFINNHEIVTAMNHHATSNLIPHAYNGNPTAPPSGREDDYAKFCHDMTRYNRYIYGEAPDILTIANGDMSDWMLGGVLDPVNNSVGSGQGILALAPENGAWDGSEGGFWPNPSDITDIAQRAVRMNFMNAYYSGKFAQFHDLNPSDITSTSGNLTFGVEFLGQTLGDITLNVTPVSANILSMTPPATQTGWTKLEQRELSVPYTLDPGIQTDDIIEFQITLSNDDGYVMYQANIVKFYSPTVLFYDNPDVDGLSNWNNGGGTWNTTTDAYSGSTAITDSPSGSYSNNTIQRLTLNAASAVDLSGSQSAVVQFYAKWDLERNFDYVQLEGSTDGSNWFEMCGTYTKPGSDRLTTRYSSSNSSNSGPGKNDPSDLDHQPDGEALYDGYTMGKWVMEEFVIDDNNNSFLLGASSVRFRFTLDSDSSNRADGYSTTFDGFSFDDFKVVDIKIPCVLQVPVNVTANSITSSQATITWDDIVSATYDLRYRQTGTSTWTEVLDINPETYNITGLAELTQYEVQVRSRCTTTTSAYTSSTLFTTLEFFPCTGTTITSFPYLETFDTSIGDWTQATTGDDGDWLLDSNGTPSGGSGTGPSDDITGGGQYLYIEASNNGTPGEIGANASAILISPCFVLSDPNYNIFSFYYHMYGNNTGSLNVEITNDDGGIWTNVFSQTGNQGDQWFAQTIDLTSYIGETVKFRFTGTTGNGFASDIAIDHMSITDTPPYCTSQATNDTNQLGIGNVQFNGINNASAIAVYSDFTSTVSTTVARSTTYSLSITPSYNVGTNNAVGYRVWIDYNRNGDFTDPGEEVFSQNPITGGGTVSGNVTIPASIVNGNTRMRVSMAFNQLPDPCTNFNFGEVEDYSVFLFDGLLYQNSTWAPSAPNGTTSSENILIFDGIYSANANIAVNEITINSGAQITLNKANAITANGDIVNNGEFILNSDSNEYSSLIANGTVTGNVKYNRHVNSNTNRNDLISPPVSGQTFVDFISNNANIFANGTQTLYLFGDFEKPVNEYQLFTNTENHNLTAGKGYRAASTNNSTFQFDGAVLTNNLNVPIERSGTTYAQWNLIGNPFTSYIKLSDFLTANLSELNASTAAVYGYDANPSGGYWAIWNMAYSDANPNALIAPGQGFFVSSKLGGGNISFTTSMRETGTSDDFIAGRSTTNNEIAYARIKMSNTNNSYGTEVYFTNNATLAMDLGYDAEHFGDAPSEFSIFTEIVENNNGMDIAVQSIAMTDINNTTVIPLGLNLPQGEQVTISIEDVSNVDFNIYLEDTETNTYTLLNDVDYTFTPLTDISGIGRFNLRFENTTLSTNDETLNNLQVINDPSNEQIIIKGLLNPNSQFSLYDIQGRQILNQSLDSQNNINTIKTAGFSSGVYVVKVSDTNNSISKKVILE